MTEYSEYSDKELRDAIDQLSSEVVFDPSVRDDLVEAREEAERRGLIV